MKKSSLIIVTAGLAALACSSNNVAPPPPAVSITFQLQNDGSSTVYVFEGCQLDFAITALADPAYAIPRSEGCACQCGQTCPVCGPCFEGPLGLAVGGMMTAEWSTVDVTTEQTSTGTCERSTPLPDGAYRIDVPVYGSRDDALAKTSARTASQTFTLPVVGNLVHVQLGQSP